MVELTNCLAEQPQWIVDRIADRHLGITFKHKDFAPSVGNILEMVANLQDMKARYDHYGEAQSRRQMPRMPVRASSFRPFPKLWAAFADEPEIIKILDNPETFDFLNEASKRLATRGKDAARKFIYPQPVDTRATSEAA